MKIKEISIIGMGFSGSSLGLAFKQYLPGVVITGIDKGSVLIRAKNIGALDKGCIFEELEQGVKDADLVVFATTIRTVEELLPKVSKSVKKNAVVTDTCNTKTEIVDLAENLFVDGASFVGGHPIIGYKRGGIEQADPLLFVNVTYVLTPTGRSSQGVVESLENVVRSIGAAAVIMSPQEHDDLNCVLNHMLQLMSIAQVNTMISGLDTETDETAVALAGERFKQFAEALLTPSYFWGEILESNKSCLEKNVDLFVDRLKKLSREVGTGEFDGKYEKARKFVRKVPIATKGFKSTLFDIYVTIEDKTGAIARLTSLIATETFNIRDIGIVKIKEGETAVLRIAFSDQSTASKAGSFLIKNGYSCRTQYDYEEFCI
jgi:prephenate dehydrogenase